MHVGDGPPEFRTFDHVKRDLSDRSKSSSPARPLGGRSNLGDEVANERLVRQRRQDHLARFKPCRAGIDRLAVELDDAFLARIRIDARKTDCQRRIPVHAQPAQPVKHGLARLERHLIGLEAPRFPLSAAPYLEPCHIGHGATSEVTDGERRTCSASPDRYASWLTSPSAESAEKSSR